MHYERFPSVPELNFSVLQLNINVIYGFNLWLARLKFAHSLAFSLLYKVSMVNANVQFDFEMSQQYQEHGSFDL